MPTAVPGLTNAIAAPTGTRIRRLPITKTIRVMRERHVRQLTRPARLAERDIMPGKLAATTRRG